MVFLSVSVIVPVYNGARTIISCLESLLVQDYPNELYEIIVVENGSTDETTNLVKKYPVRLLHCERKGPAFARNFGVQYSKAELIAFTDSDCVADPQWLKNLVSAYEDAQVAGAGGKIIPLKEAEYSHIQYYSEINNPLENFLSGEGEFLPHLYTANASYRREMFLKISGFNDKLLTAEDVDLSWRLQLAQGCKLAYVEDALVYHHHRVNKKALARQYRQYGYGEILIDALYHKFSGYPRGLRYQITRLFSQVMALFRYTGSLIIRRYRFQKGMINEFEAIKPGISFLLEWNNILGKVKGLYDTRLMKNLNFSLSLDTDRQLDRFYGKGETGS